MINVFISQPMTGKTEEEILSKRTELIAKIKECYGDCNIINSYTSEDEDLACPNPYLYYLGKAIQKMAEANVIIFAKQWEMSTGCLTEFNLCQKLDISYDFENSIDYKLFRAKKGE